MPKAARTQCVFRRVSTILLPTATAMALRSIGALRWTVKNWTVKNWTVKIAMLACGVLSSVGCESRTAGKALGLKETAWLEYSEQNEPKLMRLMFLDLNASVNRDFKDLPTLECVEINECRRDGSPLIAEIAALPELKSLSLNHVPLTDDEFSQLSRATKLVSLELLQTGITGQGLAHLRELPLKRLLLSDSSITREGLASLVELPELEELVLQLPAFAASSLPSLAGLNKLKSLRITRINFDYRVNGGLNCLENADGIEQLEICGEKLTSRVLTAISRLKGLKSLKIENPIIEDEGLEPLLALQQLEHLELHHCEELTDRSLTMLASLTRLKSLRLTEIAMEARTLSQLAQIRGLEQLTLFGRPVEIELISQFQSLKADCQLSTSAEQTDSSHNQFGSFVSRRPRSSGATEIAISAPSW